MATESKVFYAQEYDKSDYRFSSITQEEGPVGRPAADNTRPAVVYMPENSPYETYIYWPFDLSAIPEDAAIDSIECVVLASMTSTVNVTVAEMRLYSGNTPKGTAASFLSDQSKYYTIQTGSWTRSEIAACRLKMTANAKNGYIFSRGMSFNGATLTVTYTYRSEKFEIKLVGSYRDTARNFKKIKGVWVEVDDLSTAVDTSKKLVNGGEITN